MSWTLEALLLELNPGSRTFLHVTGQVTLFLPHFSFLQMGIIIDTQVLGLWALVANKTKQNKNNPPVNAGDKRDTGLIPGSRRSLG